MKRGRDGSWFELINKWLSLTHNVLIYSCVSIKCLCSNWLCVNLIFSLSNTHLNIHLWLMLSMVNTPDFVDARLIKAIPWPPRQGNTIIEFPVVIFSLTRERQFRTCYCYNFSDVIYIGNTIAQHYDVCKMMLLADKHVLCEKSLTCSVKGSEELFNLAKERQRFLMEVGWHDQRVAGIPLINTTFIFLISSTVLLGVPSHTKLGI